MSINITYENELEKSIREVAESYERQTKWALDMNDSIIKAAQGEIVEFAEYDGIKLYLCRKDKCDYRNEEK